MVTPARAQHRRRPAGHPAGRASGAGGAGGRDSGGRAGDRTAWAAQVEGPVLVDGGAAGGLTALRGGPFLHRTAAGRTWRVSAGVFWQVHPAAADAAGRRGRWRCSRPQPGDVALDLYCGAGLFAGVLAAGGRAGRGGDRHRVRPGRGPRRPAQPAGHPLGPGAPRRRGRGARARRTGTRPAWRCSTRPGPARPARCWTCCCGRAPRCAGSPTCPATRPRWPATSRCSPRPAGNSARSAPSTRSP